MFANNNHKKQFQIPIFQENALVILISFVTLLLQLISFATTWNGSRIYLEGIFPFASLLFAISIQATAYFFSNSLRNGIRIKKVIALAVTLCCSTYYSYIGIYNCVNSPITYLQEHYSRISFELTKIYEEELEKNQSKVKEAISEAASNIISTWTTLDTQRQKYVSCQNALNDIAPSYSKTLRAPKQSSFETYEEYAIAYQAYINSITMGNKVENSSVREEVLSSYGFSSVEELYRKEAQNTAQLKALASILNINFMDEESEHEDFSFPMIEERLATLTNEINYAIERAFSGYKPGSSTYDVMNTLFHAAALCNYHGMKADQIMTILNLCGDTTKTNFLPEYETLVAAISGNAVNDSNLMELKSIMDSSILSAIMKLNSIISEERQLSYTDEQYQIIDLYLVPVFSLKNESTRTTAVFCLVVAGLIDFLSVLFAVSLKPQNVFWKKRVILSGKMEEYAPYLLAALPDAEEASDILKDFLDQFKPSPFTGKEGFMLQGELSLLSKYNTLVALLCQLNLARVISSEDKEHSVEMLLLKTRFVLWAISIVKKEESMNLKPEGKSKWEESIV